MSSYRSLIEEGLDNVKLATSLDSAGLYPEALNAYRKGIEIFMIVLKHEENPTANSALQQKLKEYLARAEMIKSFLGQSSAAPAATTGSSPPTEKAPIPPTKTETLQKSATTPQIKPTAAPSSTTDSLIDLNTDVSRPTPAHTLPFENSTTPFDTSLVSMYPMQPTPLQTSTPFPPPTSASSPASLSPTLSAHHPSTPAPAHAPTPEATDVLASGQNEKRVALLHTIRIGEGERGHTYVSIFGPYASQVETVVLADPYLRERHQFFNLIRFAEMLVLAKSVRLFTVITKADNDMQKEAIGEFMTELATSLFDYQITLRYAFQEHLHDREVHFETKFIARLGRGLDFYQKPSSRFCIGLNDYSLRPCKQTLIDIYAFAPPADQQPPQTQM